mgnify:CR=1 FL=1
MTNKEKHQAINREFCERYENDFDIDDEMGGRLILIPFECDGNINDNSIEYHQSRHTIDCYNEASPATKEFAADMELFIEELMKQYGL